MDLDIGESHESWVGFLKKLKTRGLSGVKLVISDAFDGLKSAITQVFGDATRQRCKVHLMRNIPCSGRPMVAAMLRMVFLKESRDLAKQ